MDKKASRSTRKPPKKGNVTASISLPTNIYQAALKDAQVDCEGNFSLYIRRMLREATKAVK